jgi:hypothetical protein
MGGITIKSLDEPDETIDFGAHGRADGVSIGDSEVWRSVLQPGWSWDEDLKPLAEGHESCPLTHREYVVSGRIRYITDDGTEVTGKPGDHLVIEPGHRASVVGDEPCVLIDW